MSEMSMDQLRERIEQERSQLFLIVMLIVMVTCILSPPSLLRLPKLLLGLSRLKLWAGGRIGS